MPACQTTHFHCHVPLSRSSIGFGLLDGLASSAGRRSPYCSPVGAPTMFDNFSKISFVLAESISWGSRVSASAHRPRSSKHVRWRRANRPKADAPVVAWLAEQPSLPPEVRPLLPQSQPALRAHQSAAPRGGRRSAVSTISPQL